MNEILRVFLAIFAIYRAASLISSEEGPYISWPKTLGQIGIFKILRIKAGVFDRDETTGEPKTSLARGISCPLCVGIYISLLVTFAIFFHSMVGDFFIAWFGLAGAQVFLENLTSDDAIQSAIEDVAKNIEN